MSRYHCIYIFLSYCPSVTFTCVAISEVKPLILKKSSCGRFPCLRNSRKNMTTAQPCVIQWGFADGTSLELSMCCSEMNAAPRYSSGGNKHIRCCCKTLFKTFMCMGSYTAKCFSGQCCIKKRHIFFNIEGFYKFMKVMVTILDFALLLF